MSRFLHACRLGELDYVKEHVNDIIRWPKIINHSVVGAITHKHQHIVIWLMDNNKVTQHGINMAFRTACFSNQYDLANYLFLKGADNIQEILDTAYTIRDTDVINWVIRSNDLMIHVDKPFVFHELYHLQLLDTCVILLKRYPNECIERGVVPNKQDIIYFLSHGVNRSAFSKVDPLLQPLWNELDSYNNDLNQLKIPLPVQDLNRIIFNFLTI